jgi:hypothetical protein
MWDVLEVFNGWEWIPGTPENIREVMENRYAGKKDRI